LFRAEKLGTGLTTHPQPVACQREATRVLAGDTQPNRG
jgi:hypothetical protein